MSGAIAGVKRKLDLFGVLVLSFVAANTGGITFFFPSAVVRRAVLVFDAGRLALFAVSGAGRYPCRAARRAVRCRGAARSRHCRACR
ncbi:hypothetical protein [Bradyrhizobium sp. 76]|uniref:hypothetical protein n=1 Tax=Bradyrhizobium sp. 76 TaxID=2782680 RepID=UPI001FF7D4DC|nr:hypothetical protein [Bradyrhizobium sp. 76]